MKLRNAFAANTLDGWLFKVTFIGAVVFGWGAVIAVLYLPLVEKWVYGLWGSFLVVIMYVICFTTWEEIEEGLAKDE
jgi:hydrogenase/urease accessory protein HupE